MTEPSSADDELDVGHAFKTHRVGVFNFLRRCGTPREVAEDLTQAAFLVLLEHGDRYDPSRGPLLTYVLGIARNLRHAWMREERRKRGAPPERQSDRYEPSPSGSLLLDEALGLLSPEAREALVLRELHGLSYEEIAVIQGIPVGTVGSRLSTARRCLRRLAIGSIETRR